MWRGERSDGGRGVAHCDSGEHSGQRAQRTERGEVSTAMAINTQRARTINTVHSTANTALEHGARRRGEFAEIKPGRVNRDPTLAQRDHWSVATWSTHIKRSDHFLTRSLNPAPFRSRRLPWPTAAARFAVEQAHDRGLKKRSREMHYSQRKRGDGERQTGECPQRRGNARGEGCKSSEERASGQEQDGQDGSGVDGE